jgi:glycosyltransferase involved in cell wall biosynthesis
LRRPALDAEIVVIDNGSEDDTPAILRQWAANSPIPVNLQFEPQKGASKARNRGLKFARGALLVCRL